jgi:hypothetical protein
VSVREIRNDGVASVGGDLAEVDRDDFGVDAPSRLPPVKKRHGGASGESVAGRDRGVAEDLAAHGVAKSQNLAVMAG